jgi:lathosterol oxidase
MEMMIWVFLILIFRYYIGSAVIGFLFYKWKKPFFDTYRIQRAYPQPSQIQTEKMWMLRSLPVDFVILGIMLALYNSGHTQIYFEIEKYGWVYWILSLLALTILQDMYFYFTHRLLHWKPLFKRVHWVHHISTNPTQWASFCFHPVEKFIELGFFPLVILALPLHPSSLIIFAFVSSLLNMLGHSGYEFGALKMGQSALARFRITSTHHNLHHQSFNYNYSLYFNFWDQLLKTEHPEYLQRFEEVLTRRKS